MRRRSRTRRVVKRAPKAASVVILLACVATQLVGVEYYTATKNRYVALSNGAFIFEQVGVGGPFADQGPRIRPRWGLYFPYHWRPHPYTAGVGSLAYRDVEVAIPLWMLGCITIILTLFLWWVDRRIPAGHCQKCGCDLTGNVSGRCPECGETVK